ncbi:MAG: aminotransferase class III-fold pyridoxal phosphate-dependent enzyme, partial [Cyanobacteriota bacterium]
EVVKAAMDAGLLLVPAGSQVVRFVPPLIVTPAEIDQALALLESALQGLAAAHPRA